MSTITGGCHCGAVRYELEGDAIVSGERAQGDQGRAPSLQFLGTRPATLLRPLWHRPVLYQCRHAARHHRHPERDLRRSRCRAGDDAHPGRRAASLDGARAQVADVRALSAAAIAAEEPQRATLRRPHPPQWTRHRLRRRSKKSASRSGSAPHGQGRRRHAGADYPTATMASATMFLSHPAVARRLSNGSPNPAPSRTSRVPTPKRSSPARPRATSRTAWRRTTPRRPWHRAESSRPHR